MLRISCLQQLFSFHLNPVKPLIRHSSSLPIVTEKRDGILFITINRPDKRNCINSQSAKLLFDAFKQLDCDDDIKVGILHGKGGNFCAGYDLTELAQSCGTDGKDGNKSELIKPAPMGPSHLMIKKPTIAAIDGYAVAGGLELALLCDIRIAEDTAQLGVFNRRFGVPLIDGGTVRLPKIIGLGRALDMIITGRAIDGKEAFKIGLTTMVCPTGCALGQAIKLAPSIMKFNQECLIADKMSCYNSTFNSTSMADALNYEYQNGKRIIETVSVKGAKMFVDGHGKHGKFGFDTLEDLMKGGKKKSKLLDD